MMKNRYVRITDRLFLLLGACEEHSATKAKLKLEPKPDQVSGTLVSNSPDVKTGKTLYARFSKNVSPRRTTQGS